MVGRPTLTWFIFFLVTTISSGKKSELVAGKPLQITASTFHHNHPSPRRLLPADTQGFISIDCGISPGTYYTDDRTQITYASDSEFTDTGVNYNVSMSENPSKQLMNVRSFPEGVRNCYTLEPENGKGSKYLIRVFFMYGNYDSKNQPPVFKLYLGVDEWETVNFNINISNQIVRKEIIHVPKTDYIDVCLVNNGSGTPFISALELRQLGNSSYNKTERGSLLLFNRWDFGSEQENVQVRYKEDAFDRIWNSYKSAAWESINAGFESYSYSDNPYILPGKVMATAATPKNGSEPLRFFLDTDDSSQKFYLYMHFSEILELQDNQSRVFMILLNGIKWSNPVTPKHLSSTTIYSTNSVKGSKLEFSLEKTSESVLSPIINALEVYVIKEFSQSTTDQDDVEAIKKIKSVYSVRRNWQGDPCLPMDYRWNGLTCSENDYPTLISLNLSYSNLTGQIHSSFSNLKSLQNLDLSYNNLTGSVPEFLAELPSLTSLNLEGNNLKGSVPLALLEKYHNGTLSLSVGTSLCMSVSCKGKRHKSFIIPVLLSVISVLVLFLLIAFGMIWHFKRKDDRAIEMVIKEGSLRQRNSEFTYSELVTITRNFSSTIGQGGFGNVHLGTLVDGTQVAVKLRSQSSMQGPKEFRAEAKLLMRVHHKNLVRLVGYCNDGTNMALIYEYMSNGNLRQRLSDSDTDFLYWKERIQIAVDAARGLEYLHNGCKPPIIHRDLKTSNILLNEKLQAKIADFGLSRDLATESGPHVITVPAGTPGYLDPEYYSSGNLNKKSDVYSFGIVLLELITGQPVIIPPGNTHIIQWISSMIKRGDIQNIVDPRLQGAFNINSAWKAVETALACVPSTAIQRPDMSNVLADLKDCLEIEVGAMRAQRTDSYNMGSSKSLKGIPVDLEGEMAPHLR